MRRAMDPLQRADLNSAACIVLSQMSVTSTIPELITTARAYILSTLIEG